MKGTSIQLEKHTQFKGEITMKNKMSKVLKNEKGLTLIELLAVIVILAIISAIAIPAIGNIVENSRYNAVKSDAINVINAANLYFTEVPTATKVSVTDLKTNKYLESEGSIPIATEISKSSPITIISAEVTYSGNKKVTFTNATLKGITSNTVKGSGAGGYTIGKSADETVVSP